MFSVSSLHQCLQRRKSPSFTQTTTNCSNLLVTNAIVRWFLVQCLICNQFYSATGTTCQLGRKYTYFPHNHWLYRVQYCGKLWNHTRNLKNPTKSFLLLNHWFQVLFNTVWFFFFFLNMAHLSNSLDEQVGQNTQLVDQDQSPKTLTCPSPSSIYSLC